MTDEPKITLKVKLDDILQTIGNKVTSWSNTPSNDKYPSEKLVKDSLDGKASSSHSHNIKDLGAISTYGDEIIAEGEDSDGAGLSYANGKLIYNSASTKVYYDKNGNADYDNGNILATLNDIPNISTKENISNKVTSISSSSTDTQYPSAKAVFNLKEELDGKFGNCMKNTDFFDMLDCINVNFNNLDNIYLLDTVFNISNYNGLPSKNSSVVNDILRNNAVSQISLNKEFTPSTKYTLEFDYYTSVSNRNGFYFGADPSLEDGVSITNSDDGLQVLVDIGNTFVGTFNGTSSPTNVYTHTSNLFTSGTHHIRIVRNNTNVVFYIDDVELYTYTNTKYNTIGLNKWSGGYNTISNIEIKIGD